MTIEIDLESRTQLLRDGFLLQPGVLPQEMLTRLREASDRMLDNLTPEQAQKLRAQGSMLPTTGDPAFADLIAWPATLRLFHTLGFAHPTFSDGYVISKPGRSPRLFWHYDWFAWQDAVNFAAEPPQMFVMYYLSDTTRENGCLRVIPGSHIQHNPLHEMLAAPHSERLSQATDLSLPDFSDRPDEIDVPVKAGDVLVGDARLLHAAHANQTEDRRTLITLWYQPDMAALPERIQAQMAAKVQPVPEGWPEAQKRTYESLLTRYTGTAEPLPGQLYSRKPGSV